MRIYEDEDIFIDFDKRDGNILHIIFSNYSSNQQRLPSFRGDIKNLDISGIFITAKQNNFYQLDTIEWILQGLSTQTKPYKNIISFGVGLGGYAAIRFSRVLNSNISIAISPIYCADRRSFSLFDPRWEMELVSIYPYCRSISQSTSAGHAFILYDPKTDADAKHAQLISTELKQNASLVQFPYSSTPASQSLVELGNLALLFGSDGTKQNVRNIIKQVQEDFIRRSDTSSAVIHKKASSLPANERSAFLDRVKKTSRIAFSYYKATSVAEILASHNPTEADKHFINARNLMKKELFDQALLEYRLALQGYSHAYWYFLYAAALQKTKKFSESADNYSIAIQLAQEHKKEYFPLLEDWYYRLGDVYVKSKEIEKAKTAYRSALSFDSLHTELDVKLLTTRATMPAYKVRKALLHHIIDCICNIKTNVEAELKARNPETVNTAYFYWAQGFQNAPQLVKGCFNILQKNNPQLHIILIDDNTISKYVTLPEYLYNREISKPHFSDILRLHLLSENGGAWIDATCFMNTIPNFTDLLQNGDFFCFKYDDAVIGNWFLISKKNGYAVTMLKYAILSYWKTFSYTINYFFFHFIFEILYVIDEKFKSSCASKQMSAHPPHEFYYNLHKPFNADQYNKVKNETFIQKLTYKFDENKIIAGSLLDYLLKNDLK